MSSTRTTTNRTTTKAAKQPKQPAAPKAATKATPKQPAAAPAPLPVYEPATGRLHMPANGYADLAAYRDAVAAAYAAGYQAIDAAAAYAAAEQLNNTAWRNEHAAAVTALANLVTATMCVLRTLQNCGFRTGTSCLYNVVDGRVVHGVNIARKTAQRLGGSRAFARFCEQFVGVRAGTEQARRTSANGTPFMVDRRQFITA